MRKPVILLLLLAMLCSLAACGGSAADPEMSGLPNGGLSDTPPQTQAPTEIPTPQTQAAATPTNTPLAQTQVPASAAPQDSDSVDVDLTALSSTMLYPEVYLMLSRPEEYVGKTVKMRGQFAFFENLETQERHFACVISDVTACCFLGIEFVLGGEKSYPEDYPQPDSEITVTGTFEVIEGDGFRLCRLADATLSD